MTHFLEKLSPKQTERKQYCRNEENQKEKQIQTHKREHQDLRGSAFSLRPQAATRKNFTNKYREYKMMWKHSYKTQSQYTQNYSLIQVEVLSLSIQRIGLNTKFETAPKTRRSFRFSKIAAQPPSHSPLQRDLPISATRLHPNSQTSNTNHIYLIKRKTK